MKLIFAAFLLSLGVFQAEAYTPANTPEEEIHFADGCVSVLQGDDEWNLLPRTENMNHMVSLGFDFTFGAGNVFAPENTYDATYISDNGLISFGGGISDRYPTSDDFDQASGSTFQRNILAPFWADIDVTSFPDFHANLDGNIYYKTVGDKFAVTWHEVASFGAPDADPKVNTFQVVLTADDSPSPKICFCYCKMEWASVVPLNEVVARPALVGINPSNVLGADENWVLGTFAKEDNTWNGYGSSGNGIKALQANAYCFDESVTAVQGTGIEPDVTKTVSGACGDPHFKTWQNEHFEYHGQCDLVLTKDAKFAEGLGLDVHIRTKLVRFWSYIKNAVIRIGDDILEIQGSAAEGVDPEVHYWINYEYQGELTEFAGFPVTISSEGTKSNKNRIEIDLSSKYPGQKIVLATFKEFVKVDFENASEESFGNSVGMLGDYKSGKTVARDGATVLDDYSMLGHEWQVLPSDGKFFREASEPQFPKKCIDPEDPQGERRRRLAESTISMEQAEAACAGLKDSLDRKDCVYDILATQDLDMAGAF